MDIFVEQNIHILVQKSSLKFEIQMNIQVPSSLATMYAAQDRQAGWKNIRKDQASTKYKFWFSGKNIFDYCLNYLHTSNSSLPECLLGIRPLKYCIVTQMSSGKYCNFNRKWEKLWVILFFYMFTSMPNHAI